MSRSATLSWNEHQETFALNEVEDWCEVALRVRALLAPGVVVALSGPLGAGKTTFTQVLATELGIRETPQSPTFSLLRTYRIPKGINGVTRMVHVDAYRIEDESDLLPLDLHEELQDGKTFLMVEWPEKIAGWIQKHADRTIFLSIQL
jgi:tRNA threonylcarbamoyl adenosine modification protein YjeE